MSTKKTRGLFDEHFRLDKINTLKDPLTALNEIIKWEDFRSIIEGAFADVNPSKGGRPPYDRVMMFKVLVLQRMYNLSDDAAEFQILDRMSFNRFLGLELCDNVPDSKTIWNFREQLVIHDVFNRIFEMLHEKLAKKGLILNNGSIVDAHIVQVPKQRNTKEENDQIKKGEVPQEWKDKPNKLYQKDTDARWLKKNGKDFFGYKNNIKIDTESKLVTKFVSTPASAHDSVVFGDLLDENDKNKPIHGDSAYSGDPCKKIIRKHKAVNKINEKAYRNNPLTEKQIKSNRIKSKTRARVEHVFGHMWMNISGAQILRCIGFDRVASAIELTNIVYNLQRACFLQTTLLKPIVL
jgi:IS5 family transposase